jgi:hypothetical protein
MSTLCNLRELKISGFSEGRMYLLRELPPKLLSLHVDLSAYIRVDDDDYVEMRPSVDFVNIVSQVSPHSKV